MLKRLTTILLSFSLPVASASASTLDEQIERARAVDRAIVAGSVVPPGTDARHATTEVAAYDDLVRDYPDLAESGSADEQHRLLTQHYFKDAKFGPYEGAVIQRQYSPKRGLTILRDEKWGIPYIFGETDADAWFGAGYVTAEDRLPIMELLRAAGRAEAFELAGTAAAWLADAEFVRLYGYTEKELEKQAEDAWRAHWDPKLHNGETAHYPAGYVNGATADEYNAMLTRTAVLNYVAGINAYISRIQSGELPLPEMFVERGVTLRSWTPGDVVAATMLVRALFGAGGGAELTNAIAYMGLLEEFGETTGKKIYEDMRNRLNLDAPVHTADTSFRYMVPPFADPNRADADNGNVMNFAPGEPGLQGYFQRAFEKFQGMFSDSSSDMAQRNLGDWQVLAQRAQIRWDRMVWNTDFGKLDLSNGGGSMSNYMAAAKERSQFGAPILLGGPQAAYFSPQILFEYEMHGETIHTRGGGFPGLGLGPVVGRADRYAWSPTAGNGDMIDTFVEELCEPGGAPATEQSRHYLHQGECKPMERRVIREVAAFGEDQIDLQGIPFSELTDIVAERTVHGPVIARGTVDGKPVAVSRARSTFLKEAHGAIALVRLATGQADTAEKFHQAFSPMNLSSNWTYVNGNEIAYWHAGLYPIRDTRIDPDFPVWGTGAWDWKGILDPYSQPHGANPDRAYYVSWNNRIAPNWAMQDVKWGFSSLYRADMFEDRFLADSGAQDSPTATLTPVKMVKMMQEAGVTDFRASHVAPLVLQILDASGLDAPSPLAAAMVDVLRSWINDPEFPALRRDANDDNFYDNPGTAVMDAVWVPLIEGIFTPILGDLSRIPLAFDNAPGPLGSAYQDGYYGHVWTQLAQVLGETVQSPTHANYCGGTVSGADGDKTVIDGDLNACAAVLWQALETAGASASQQQGNDPASWRTLHEPEKIRFVPGAAITMHWNNRPTYQTLNMFQPETTRPEPPSKGRPEDAGKPDDAGRPENPGRAADRR